MRKCEHSTQPNIESSIRDTVKTLCRRRRQQRAGDGIWRAHPQRQGGSPHDAQHGPHRRRQQAQGRHREDRSAEAGAGARHAAHRQPQAPHRWRDHARRWPPRRHHRYRWRPQEGLRPPRPVWRPQRAQGHPAGETSAWYLANTWPAGGGKSGVKGIVWSALLCTLPWHTHACGTVMLVHCVIVLPLCLQPAECHLHDADLCRRRHRAAGLAHRAAAAAAGLQVRPLCPAIPVRLPRLPRRSCIL